MLWLSDIPFTTTSEVFSDVLHICTTSEVEGYITLLGATPRWQASGHQKHDTKVVLSFVF